MRSLKRPRLRATQQTARKRTAATDVFGGDAPAGFLPLLIFHPIRAEPSYWQPADRRDEGLTQGVISVNPNTMYHCFATRRQGDDRGSWSIPTSGPPLLLITESGEAAYQELLPEIEPFLDSVIRR